MSNPLQDLLQTLSPPQQAAINLIKLSLDCFNSADGTGMFSGVERYNVLAGRVEITLDPHTPDATRASVAHAMACWDGYIGGQGRQGRGRMAVLANDLPDAAAYLEHIEEYSEAMRQGLTTGGLGTAKLLCAPK